MFEFGLSYMNSNSNQIFIEPARFVCSPCYVTGFQYIGFLYFVIYMMRRACGFDVSKVERKLVVHELNCYWTKSSVSGIITIIGSCGCRIFLMILVLFLVLINNAVISHLGGIIPF